MLAHSAAPLRWTVRAAAATAVLLAALLVLAGGVASGMTVTEAGNGVAAISLESRAAVDAVGDITASHVGSEGWLFDDLVLGCCVAPRGAPCNSFVPGTLVLMADGSSKPIEDVGLGDEVWAADPVSGEQGPREVTQLITGHGDKTLVDIQVDGDVVTATDRHPIWVNGDGVWVDAADVAPGDYLLDEHGVSLLVDDVDVRHVVEQTVHNLSVDDLHTFFVLAGDDPILTHNSGCGAGDAPRFVSGSDGIIDTASPALRSQIDNVAESMTRTGSPPPGVRQGGLPDQPGVYGNKGAELPAREPGYYRESDVWPGPGPRGTERVVVGNEGEVWYTPDHYGTFRPVP